MQIPVFLLCYVGNLALTAREKQLQFHLKKNDYFTYDIVLEGRLPSMLFSRAFLLVVFTLAITKSSDRFLQSFSLNRRITAPPLPPLTLELNSVMCGGWWQWWLILCHRQSLSGVFACSILPLWIPVFLLCYVGNLALTAREKQLQFHLKKNDYFTYDIVLEGRLPSMLFSRAFLLVVFTLAITKSSDRFLQSFSLNRRITAPPLPPLTLELNSVMCGGWWQWWLILCHRQSLSGVFACSILPLWIPVFLLCYVGNLALTAREKQLQFHLKKNDYFTYDIVLEGRLPSMLFSRAFLLVVFTLAITKSSDRFLQSFSLNRRITAPPLPPLTLELNSVMCGGWWQWWLILCHRQYERQCCHKGNFEVMIYKELRQEKSRRHFSNHVIVTTLLTKEATMDSYINPMLLKMKLTNASSTTSHTSNTLDF
ncbi:hypothetical protein QVD17_16461 [Tagetes erecta]|uniref:Uncharacterized protein n=1 Tax=Tagetes erecta TaxID=13708 RepID=A0AAD8KWU0_TARER|nr:hypothetical protein QVD17_16461 [Tagetes erecta]